ncbi:efflux RND transporter periplasmic adaptor subunit [Formicincola oecophyllae]|uniref:Efflux RND transporter periplasmic adaptor subunit n=1 Tax=Formicincola oecophyllae TaxID=2558361 RepID=A0A4Y6UA61_9PROT|nr:efflux RND transporter periplasmic adaptor subunit [Formicincola oecophyllae]
MLAPADTTTHGAPQGPSPTPPGQNAPDLGQDSPPPSALHGGQGAKSHGPWRRRLLLGGAVLLGALVVWRLLPHKTHHHTPTQPAPVAVATASWVDMPVIYKLLGTVVPVDNVTVTPRVNGYIMEVYYHEGQRVHKGDLLELIDTRPYEATLHQAEGQLAADKAQLVKAQVDNQRYQRLLREHSTSDMLARDQAYTVQQLQGQVAADEANVYNAKLNIMYCHITAPADGRIGIRVLDKGNYVTVGQSNGVAIITQMQPMSVIFTLAQNGLPDVWQEISHQATLPVEAWSADESRKIADGTTNALDSQIDTATGTVRMRGIFPNKPEVLFPNEFVNAHLRVKTLHHVLAVPTIAVQAGPDGPFLWVVQPDGHVKAVDVATGYSNDSQTVITKGIDAGARVVTDGINHLRSGAKVTIAPTALSIAQKLVDKHVQNQPTSAKAPAPPSPPLHHKGHGH